MQVLTRSSIESMKMETVIRSPQDGIVKKLAHKEGVRQYDLVTAFEYDANLCFYRISARRARFLFSSRRRQRRMPRHDRCKYWRNGYCKWVHYEFDFHEAFSFGPLYHHFKISHEQHGVLH